MLFNSFQFLWLFPLIFIAYYLVNRLGGGKRSSCRVSNFALLILSYGLYLQWNPVCVCVLMYVTSVTFFGGIIFTEIKKWRKLLMWFFVLLSVFPLGLFKYYNFAMDSLTDILQYAGLSVGLDGLNWAIPLGISFFTFQALGYMLDVYHGRVTAERNWWDYMLFVGFFPQIASGPISKANELLPQIKSVREFDQYKAVVGLRWLLWGMFMKVVVADRLGVYVDKVYDTYMYQSGLTCSLAAVMYSFQIYADFAGYSLMAIGVGRLMGFNLVNNFNRPYCASSVTDFWKRWHISLTRWLTTHIYIAMGGNRCSKLRQYWNIMVTFLVSGIWHGANWTFIVWGLIHGVLQIAEKMTGLDPKGRLSQSSFVKKMTPVRVLFTFLMVTVAWVFFRMSSIDKALDFFSHIGTNHSCALFVPAPDTMLLIFLAMLCVVAKDWVDELLPSVKLMSNKHLVIRWATYIVLCFWILLAGVFDASNFIYANF